MHLNTLIGTQTLVMCRPQASSLKDQAGPSHDNGLRRLRAWLEDMKAQGQPKARSFQCHSRVKLWRWGNPVNYRIDTTHASIRTNVPIQEMIMHPFLPATSSLPLLPVDFSSCLVHIISTKASILWQFQSYRLFKLHSIFFVQCSDCQAMYSSSEDLKTRQVCQ